MRNFLLTSTAALVLAVTSIAGSAADLQRFPTKAAPWIPGYDWSGFYVGGNIGGSFGKTTSSVSTSGIPFATSSPDTNGFAGGGQVGVNWQVGQWVWGLEADYQGSTQKGSASVAGTTITVNEGLPWFGTARGRIGFTLDPRWLIYTTGGFAYGEADTTFTDAGMSLGSFNDTRLGWTVGGGVEAALWGDWTAKIEYLYVDLGRVTDGFTDGGLPGSANTKTANNVVRAGLNYRFGH